MKVQPFAYQIGHFVLEVFYGRPGLKALNRGCLRPTSESLTLATDQPAALLWGNGAEAVSTTIRRPPHHLAVSRVLGEGLGLGRAACGVVSTTATSTRLLPLLGRGSRAWSSLTTRPAPSAHRAAHQEVLWCSR